MGAHEQTKKEALAKHRGFIINALQFKA
jgi:hypothetical protein